MKDYCVILLEAPGHVHVMRSKKVPDLETVHKLVNCDLVETVNLCNDFIMLVDDEGLLKEETLINVFASLIYSGDPGSIAGNALILKRDRDNWRALTFREGAYILTVIKAAFEQWCESL